MTGEIHTLTEAEATRIGDAGDIMWWLVLPLAASIAGLLLHAPGVLFATLYLSWAAIAIAERPGRKHHAQDQS